MVLIHRQNAIREFIDGEAHVKGIPAGLLRVDAGLHPSSRIRIFQRLCGFLHDARSGAPAIVYSYIVEVSTCPA